MSCLPNFPEILPVMLWTHWTYWTLTDSSTNRLDQHCQLRQELQCVEHMERLGKSIDAMEMEKALARAACSVDSPQIRSLNTFGPIRDLLNSHEISLDIFTSSYHVISSFRVCDASRGDPSEAEGLKLPKTPLTFELQSRCKALGHPWAH